MIRFISFLFLIILFGCRTEYSQNDFYNSKWLSQECSSISFYDDDTFMIENFKWNFIYFDLVDSLGNEYPSSFRGHWKVVDTSMGYQRIECSFNKKIFYFDIYDDSDIRSAIGDPDEGVYYTFKRI